MFSPSLSQFFLCVFILFHSPALTSLVENSSLLSLSISSWKESSTCATRSKRNHSLIPWDCQLLLPFLPFSFPVCVHPFHSVYFTFPLTGVCCVHRAAAPHPSILHQWKRILLSPFHSLYSLNLSFLLSLLFFFHHPSEEEKKRSRNKSFFWSWIIRSFLTLSLSLPYSLSQNSTRHTPTMVGIVSFIVQYLLSTSDDEKKRGKNKEWTGIVIVIKIFHQ